jgi:alpha-beta hydrolase superfamily lysophospholipase
MSMKRLSLLAFAFGSMLLVGCSGPPSYPPRQPSTPPPAMPEGVDHTTGYFNGVNGVTLFEQSWRPKGDSAGKAVLVIVHGLKDHSDRYAVLAERLAQKGHPVYAFDLRGHAHSSGQRVGIDSFDEYLADLGTFLARVKTKEPNAKIVLMGHSMGGAIVTLYAIEKQPDLGGIITSAAALKVNVNFIKVGGTKMTAALFPHAKVFQLDLDDFSRDPKVVKEAKADGLVYRDAAPARTAKELLGAIRTIEDNMEAVKVPVLALHGAADEVTDPQGSKDLVARAGTKDKTLKIYPGLVHDLIHEPEKEKVMADIETWLEAHGSK